MNELLQRLIDYALKRLQEPTTWAGIITIIVSNLHWNLDPETQAALAQIGVTIGGLLLIIAREGRNKPDNPTLGTTIKGQLPVDAPKTIVPPPDASAMPPASATLVTDATGVVHDASAVPDKSTTN